MMQSQKVQRTLDASGIKYTVPADGKVDYAALARAIAARYPRITAYLAAN